MKDSSILKYLYLLIFTSFLIILIAFLGSTFEKVVLFDEDVTMFNNGWLYKNSDEKTVPLSLPVNLDMPSGSILKMSNTLPNNYAAGMSLSIKTTLQALRVFIDGKMIYEKCFHETWRFGNSSGSTYHIIRLPEETKSKEIILELSSPYKNQIGELPYITLGSKTANIGYIFHKQLVPFIICCISLLIGLSYIFTHLYIDRLIKGSKSLLYLGLFTVLASIWSITETNMLQFIFPYESIEYLIAYLSLMLCPIPFLLYLKGSTHSSKNILINVLCMFQMINFIVTNILAFFHISNYRTMLPITHLVILCVLLLIIYILVKEIFYYKNKDAYFFAASIAMLGIFSFVELFRFSILDTFDTSIYFRSGLLIFIILTGLSTANKLIVTLRMGINAEAIHNLAYTDILTGINNRTAYVQDIDEINKHLTSKSNILVAMLDLNNLKSVNDNFGHKAGDALLINAANFIADSVGNIGKCYRIGGDEFAVIIKDSSKETIEDCKEKLERFVQEYNKISSIHLEIPYGITYFDSAKDHDLYGSLNRADQLMYIAKGKTKANCVPQLNV
jgi:diguanylate cyclase (GGDEF)-like protein